MKSTRREFIKAAGLGLTASILGCNSSSGNDAPGIKAKKPNIIWLVSEDNSVHFCNLYNENGVDKKAAIEI